MARHRVVIVGSGFGGLAAVQALAGADVDVTLIDRRNHHLFQPLLYQVATASLSTSEIAWPIRHILRKRGEVTTLLATVTGVDTEGKAVVLEDGAKVAYDSLILATGARHAYFGHDDWEKFAPGLKTLEDATTIRRKLLLAFEAAERESDADKRRALLTFVIIGAGPTGVELAGAIVELARETLKGEFRSILPGEARVVLIEGGPRVLANFKPELSDYALKALRDLGVTVELGEAVSTVDEAGVVYGGKRLDAATVIWAAGVQASPAAKWLGVEPDRAGSVYELGGPEWVTYRQIVDEVMRVTRMRRLKVGVPIPLISALTAVTDRVLPIFPVSHDQIQSLQRPNSTDLDAFERAFGIVPRRLDLSYLA